MLVTSGKGSGDLNFQTGVITRTFTSLDPATLELPEDVEGDIGFLPPNQSPPEGEGFVTYIVRPKPGLPTGTRIDARASVVFDTNAPIDTPAIFHTLDDGPPASSVEPLAATISGEAIALSWSGNDDVDGSLGSGIAFFDIFVSGNDNYKPKTASATLTIARADPLLIAIGGTFTFDGLAHPATATVIGINSVDLGPANITYNGSPIEPLSPGTYLVVAGFAGDANYNPASANATIVISASGVLSVVTVIKPDEALNCINLKSQGKMAVAIMTTSTAQGDAVDFNTATIDAATILFGDVREGYAHISPLSSQLVDVDGDGDLDLLTFYSMSAIQVAGALNRSSTQTEIIALTFAGLDIRGTDSVRIVPGSSKGSSAVLANGKAAGTSINLAALNACNLGLKRPLADKGRDIPETGRNSRKTLKP